MYVDVYVKYQLFLSECKETLIFSTDFPKILDIKFRDNLSTGSRVPCGRADRQTQADMRKLIVDFRNFANTPKNPNSKT